MANTFVPYGLKIKDISDRSAIISWDIDNVVEFRRGTYYNIYTSNDNVTWTFYSKANLLYAGIELRSAGMYVRVTSVVLDLGESTPSNPLYISLSDASSDSNTEIAVDPSGNPTKLRVDTTGALVTAVSMSASSGMSTADLQNQQMVAAHNDAVAILNQVIDFDSNIHQEMEDLKAKVADVGYSRLLRAERVMENIGPSGMLVSLPWSQRSKIHQLTVIKEAGSCTKWTLELFNKSVPSGERSVVYRDYSYETYDPNRMDYIKTIPYINLDGNDLLVLKLTPDNGTSNNFYVIISGEVAK